MKATKIRFDKLTAWVLTLAMIMTFIPCFTIGVSADETDNYTINVSATPSEGGTVTADKYEASEGETVTLTVSSNSGYGLKTLTVDGSDVTGGLQNGQYSFTMPNGNVNAEAVFVAVYRVIVPTGSVTVTKTADTVLPIPEGGSYSFTVVINTGYEKTEAFAVKAGNKEDDVSTYTVLTPDSDGVYTITNITANQKVVVEGVVLTPPGSADVFKEGSNYPFKFVCEHNSTHEITAPYFDSTYVTAVTATDARLIYNVTFNVVKYLEDKLPEHRGVSTISESATFLAKWDIDTSKWMYTNATRTYAVTCAAETYDIRINPNSNGTVTSDKTKAAEGEPVTLTITPNENYELNSINVYCGQTELDVSDNYTFTMPAGDVTVTATYKKVYTITFNANGGTGEMAKTTAASGEYTLPECTFTAPDGKQFAGWATSADGDVITTSAINVTDDTTLYAIWEQKIIEVKWGTDAGNLTESGTLTEAIDAAEADSAIKYIRLLSDISVTEEFLITTGVFTIDLNGYTVKNTGTSKPNTFSIKTNADTYQNDLKVTFADSSTDGEGKVVSENAVAVYVNAYSLGDGIEVILEKGIYEGDTSGLTVNTTNINVTVQPDVKISSKNVFVSAVALNGGVLKMNGGTLTGKKATFDYGARPTAVATLDLSGHNKPDGMTVYASRAMPVAQVKLPADYGLFSADDTQYGETDTVAASSIVTIKSTKNCTISFDANGGTGEMAKTTAASGEYTLPECTFTAPDDKQFTGWATSAGGDVITTETIQVSNNITLYAIWEQIQRVTGISFNTESSAYNLETNTFTVAQDKAFVVYLKGNNFEQLGDDFYKNTYVGFVPDVKNSENALAASLADFKKKGFIVAVDTDTATITLSFDYAAVKDFLGENAKFEGICYGNGNSIKEENIKAVNVTVTKLDPTYTPPVPKTELVYNGAEQELITAGTVTGGTMKYYIGSAPAIEDIPTRTDAGEYRVNCIIVGDTHYNNVNIGSFVVKIAQAQPYQNPEKLTTARVRRGSKLSNASVTYGEFFAIDAATVLDGTFTWVDDTQTISENTTKKMKFTPSDDNYAEIEFDVAVDCYSSGGGSSNTTTTTTKNDDGSTTKTTTNKSTGTVTETTTYPDGSSVKVETKKDGTVTTTEKDADGNTTATVEKSDGTTVTTEKTADGTKVTTETTADGETTIEIDVPSGKETEVTVPAENAEDITSVVVTDKDGNETEITDFEITEDGIKISVSGDCTVTLVGDDAHIVPSKKVFDDVHPINHWAVENIDYVYDKGLMNGVTENTFAPDDKLTRAMLVTVLYRAEGEPDVAGDDAHIVPPFADVDMGAYYANAVIWAKQNGIVNGVTKTEFAPNDYITREQIAAIMHRYAQYKGYDVSVGENTNILSYDDFAQISEYAISSMQWAVGSGLIKGKSVSTLNPLDNATRAEIAAILHRFIEAN